MRCNIKTVLWEICASIFNRATRYWRAIKCRWWNMRFYLDAYGSLTFLNCGKGVYFRVPVRVGSGLGGVKIGDGVGFGYSDAPMLGDGMILIEPRVLGSTIEIGHGTIFSNNISIVSMGGVRIGDRCLIGDLVSIYDCDFHEVDPKIRRNGFGSVEPVIIGDNVWIGSRVQVLRGVSIGDNSVIGTGSVVAQSIPANCIAVGVPAKVIRSL